MDKCIQVLVFSLLLIIAYSKPSKRKNRESESIKFEKKIEETTTEEKNLKFFTVLAELENFYENTIPDFTLTFNTDCENEEKSNETGTTTQEIKPVITILDCLTLDSANCAAKLKRQFSLKVKEEYIRALKSFITKIYETYAVISEELPLSDPHERGIQKFLNLISTDLPKLNTALDLDYLDRMFQAMHDDLKPKFFGAKIDINSQKLYESLVEKHSIEIPTNEEINEDKNAHINKIWNELVENLHAVKLLSRLRK